MNQFHQSTQIRSPRVFSSYHKDLKTESFNNFTLGMNAHLEPKEPALHLPPPDFDHDHIKYLFSDFLNPFFIFFPIFHTNLLTTAKGWVDNWAVFQSPSRSVFQESEDTITHSCQWCCQGTSHHSWCTRGRCLALCIHWKSHHTGRTLWRINGWSGGTELIQGG